MKTMTIEEVARIAELSVDEMKSLDEVVSPVLYGALTLLPSSDELQLLAELIAAQPSIPRRMLFAGCCLLTASLQKAREQGYLKVVKIVREDYNGEYT